MLQLPPDSHWARRSQTLPLAGAAADRVAVERREELELVVAGAAERSEETTRVRARAGSGRCLTFSP